MPMTHFAVQQPTSPDSTGARLVSTDGRELPLKDVRLETDAKGGIARVLLKQRFRNPYAEPLRVTYLMPLPAEGAVSGYAFVIGGRRVVGKVEKRATAREQFERAILEGRTAAILDQERSSLFTQELGNVPPNAEIEVELTVDQKLRWLPEGSWEWRFPTVVAPRYLGGPGTVADAGRVTVEVDEGSCFDRAQHERQGGEGSCFDGAQHERRPTASLALVVRDRLTGGRRPESPSHPIHATALSGRVEIGFHDEQGAALDRDVVVRWSAVSSEIGLSLELGKTARLPDSLFGLLTVVPPQPGSHTAAIPRDLIVLLDTSGSMGGEPLAQAKKVVGALIDSLGEQDRFELIEFSSAPRRWKGKPVDGSGRNRASAQRWLAGLSAGGGTEMAHAMIEALTPLRDDAQRQVVLVTDGLIGFEHLVLEAIGKRLPPRSRVHVVGVGSATNRSLSHPATRLGRGEEVLIGIGEDPERAAQRLLARTSAPLVTELQVSGEAVIEVAPARLPDLFASSPALLPVRLNPSGGSITVRGQTANGPFEASLRVPPGVEVPTGSPAVAALFGRESVEDLEVARDARLADGEVDAKVEKLGLDFQLSTRLTSWIAASDTATVDPTAPTRTTNVPHSLPYGMSAEGLGLRSAALPRMQAPGMVMAAAPTPRAALKRTRGERADAFGGGISKEHAKAPPPPKAEVFSDFDEEEASYGAPMEPPSVLEEGALRLEGMIRLFDGTLLVVELRLTTAFSWHVPSEVRLRFADGSEARARVDVEKTTAAGELTSGTVVRVSVSLIDAAPHGQRPTAMRFELGGQEHEATLR